MSSPVTSRTRVPIQPIALAPIEPPRTSVVAQAAATPDFGPVVFAQTPEAEAVRTTLAGVADQIGSAIRGVSALGDKASFAQVSGRLRAVEKSLASKALSGATLDAQLTHEEKWATGLEMGRSLRLLSQAMAGAMEGLTGAQRREVETAFANIRGALANGVGALPSVRLPPPLPTTNAQGVRLEPNDVELLRFAAGLPKALTGTLQEILRANPGDPMAVLDLIKGKPDPIVELKRLNMMFGESDPAALKKNLSADLGYHGATHEADSKAMLSGFGVRDSGPLFSMLATAREAFKRGARGNDELNPNPMDAASWLHSRLEMPHSLEGLETIRGALPGDQASSVEWPSLAQSVWLGTLASDLYKRSDFNSVLTHNRDGAELMVPLLAARHLGDLDAPENHRIVSLGKRFAHDHQIVPADTMAMLMSFELKSDTPEAKRILAKVADPFAAPSKNGELVFDDAELALLRSKNIAGWPVPSAEGDLERLIGSLAVIVGDAAQYGCEDAAAKYAVALRGPEMGMGLQNPVISSNAFAQLHPDRVAELEAGAIPDMREGAMESAFDGSHKKSVATILAGADVLGPELAQTMAAHLDAARERTAERLPELTALADAKIRAQTGDRPVHYWDVLVPGRGTDPAPLADDVASDVKLVKDAFKVAIEELFKVPAKPFEIEEGVK